MKMFGIEFAPLHVPFQRRLQTLAAAGYIFITFSFTISPFVCLYLFFTRIWWINLLYLCWIYLDRHTCEMGSRPISWVRNWTLWYYARDYFPARFACVPNFALNPTRNYLFCCFPHGIMPAGPFHNVATHASGFHQRFPNFNVVGAILHLNFFLPFSREWVLSMGGIATSVKSLNYILSRPEGGNVTLLWPGGVTEALHSKPGFYKFVVKNRKGFVKLALRNGSPLVPVITFGECDLFEQIEGPNLRRVQEVFKKYFRFSPLIINGRGFFQYSFGIIPRRKPLTTFVGTPIEVAKVENPTNEQVDELHKTFVQQLQNIFEGNKYKYLENPQDKYLELI